MFVGEGPVAVFVVEIVFAGEEVGANGFLLGLADEGGVSVAAADVDEGADPDEGLAEGVGLFPTGSPGADAAGGTTGDATHFGVLANVVALFDFGKNFFGEETGVGVAEGVVFDTAIAWFLSGLLFGESAGIDEDADGDGHVTLGDEVVEDGGGAERAVGCGVAEAVLKDHEGGGLGGVVLRREIDEVVTGGAGIDVAIVPAVLSDFAFGDVLREGVGRVVVVLDFSGASFEVVAGSVADGVIEELEVRNLFGKFAFDKVTDFLAGRLIENGEGFGIFDDPVDGSALGPSAG